MKNTIKILMAVIVASGLFSCNKNPLANYNHSTDYVVKVDSVTLSPNSKTMIKGEELQLTATVYPKGAGNKSLVWSSSNEKTAFVNQSGLVAALAEGDAVITVKTVDGGFSKTCQLTVKKPDPIYVNKIELDMIANTVKVGEKFQLTATLTTETGEDPDDKSVSWVAENLDGTTPCYGSVTPGENGTAVVEALLSGYFRVVAIANGSKEGETVSAECIVTVNEPDPPAGPVDNINGDIEDLNYEQSEKE